MFVQRLTYRVEAGYVEEALEMIKGEIAKGDTPTRVYQSYISPGDMIVQDLEFENLADLQAFWTEWFSQPDTTKFMQRWSEIVESLVTNEVWRIVE